MNLSFRAYLESDKESCLSLFDENCPDYFAPNERGDYEAYLASNPAEYELCLQNNNTVGAFGLFKESEQVADLNWIFLSLKAQGSGIGSIMMQKAKSRAVDLGVEVIQIATSHKAYKFFEKQGAVSVSEMEDGWGPGMHRIDMKLQIVPTNKS